MPQNFTNEETILVQVMACCLSQCWPKPISVYGVTNEFLVDSCHSYIQAWHSCWRHQMETFSALLAICAGNSPVSGEFPAQRPVTRSFDVFFDLRLNIWLSKQSWGWWFETPSRPLWRHCNVTGATWDCPRAREVITKQMGKIDRHYITTKHNRVQNVCIFLLMKYDDWCARSRYQGQGLVITSHIYWGM